MNDRVDTAIQLLATAAAELAEIYRPKHYGFWHQETAPRLNAALRGVDPFKEFCDVWIYTGDGGAVRGTDRFGEWAINRLVSKVAPADIIVRLSDEVSQNSATYSDVSPVFGVQIDNRCELTDGVFLTPEPEDMWASLLHRAPFQGKPLPMGTSLLIQSFTVTPAFKRVDGDELAQTEAGITAPEVRQRAVMRQRVRLACLLATIGPVELPLTVLVPDREALFVGGHGNSEERPFDPHPLVPFPVEANAVKRAFIQLETFCEIESLTRAIERLSRARIAISPVDRALELGIAAEIALMHDQSSNNTEISYKIGSRAAWLLGQDPSERQVVFTDIRKLYQARSQAVHNGALSAKSPIDLNAADQLVARILSAILARGAFPDWNKLIMGGNG